MKKGKLFIRFFFGLVAAGMFLPAQTTAESRDTIRVALSADPERVDNLRGGQNARPIFDAMHCKLMGDSDPDQPERRILQLAEKVEVAPGGKQVLIRIKKEFYFHNGEPVTAQDVQFTFNQLRDPVNANPIASLVRAVDRVEVVDDQNLVYHFKRPYAAYQDILTMNVLSKKHYETAGDKTFRDKPVGCGPFRFVSRSPGEKVVLEATDQKPWPAAAFKTLEFLTVTDPVTRVAMLTTGEIDLVANIQPHHLSQLKNKSNIKIKKTNMVPSMFVMPMRVSWYPELRDPRLRQAMAHAINRDELVEKLLMGEGYPIYFYTSRIGLDYFPDMTIEYNPEKARKLVKESGYQPGTPITLTYTSTTPNDVMLSQIIQRYLTNIGLTVRLQQLERGVYVTYLRSKDKRIGHLSLSGEPWPADPDFRFTLFYHSKGPYNSYSDRPNHQEFDQLIGRQSIELDPAKRRQLFRKIYEIEAADPQYVGLFGQTMFYAMREDIDYTWLDRSPYLVDLHKIKIRK